MTEWCLMLFSTVIQLYHGRQCICPCFPGVLLTSTPHTILSHITIARLVIYEMIISVYDRVENILGTRRKSFPKCSNRLFSSVCQNFSTQSQLFKTHRGLLKTLWDKEKLLVTIIFSFPHKVFYSSQNKTKFFSPIYLVV